MRILLAGIVAIVAAAWGADLVAFGQPTTGSLPWLIRQEAMYLSGLLAVTMMSLAMLLAARPSWLEAPLGGLDRMYRAHKWAGILAGTFAALHWAFEMSDDILKAVVGRAGRVSGTEHVGLFGELRDLAEGMGEWAIYALLAMLAITLWKRFPYRSWRFLHRAMPVIYLLSAFHAALLAPADYWTQPVGVLLALLLATGVYGSVVSLTGRIGRSRRFHATITAIERPAADVVEVRCKVDSGWTRHRPGQFAFVTFEDDEGPHPFTIASAHRDDGQVTFGIKALGDYTQRLPERLAPGQRVMIEGPYGRFDIGRLDRKARQVWIAGGIGITPFLAWMEALQTHARPPRADLHYWTRDPQSDPFVARVRSLAAKLPDVRLHLHASTSNEFLNGMHNMAAELRRERMEVWFCGPTGLANRLKEQLKALGLRRLRFHQEAFEMR